MVAAIRRPFPSGPVRLTSTLGFATIAVPLAGGRVASLADDPTHDAASFISSANADFRAHILRHFEAAEDELSALSKAIGRLDRPRRYPAACLLTPFLARETAVMGSLPATIPDGILSDGQQKLIATARAFQAAPEEARRAAIARFVDSDLADMKGFSTQSRKIC